MSVLLAACDGAGQSQDTTIGEQTTAPVEDTTQKPEQTTDGQDTESQEVTTQTQTEPETEPEPQPVTYTVSVIGSDGKPRKGAALSISKGGEQVTTAVTADDGTASFELAPDTYEVALRGLFGEKYDASNCVLTADSTSLSIFLYGIPAAGEEIYAYSESVGDHKAYTANIIGEGNYCVSLNANDMTYYLFTASRGGTFRLGLDASLAVSIGYYGSTSFVLTESIAVEENNAIVIDVYDDMVYNYAFVIGVKAEDASLSECVLTVEYLSERELTDDDMPWTDLLPGKTLQQYSMGTGTVKNFAVDSAEIKLVYSPADGYYHVGGEDGSVVLVNLGNNSQYMDALTTVCNNMRLGVYVYDENDKLLSKNSYNELIWAYDAVSDSGYYPLDDTLLDMLKTVGDYMGWYDPSSPMYLFEGVALEPANAYLFACVYLQ